MREAVKSGLRRVGRSMVSPLVPTLKSPTEESSEERVEAADDAILGLKELGPPVLRIGRGVLSLR